MGEDGIFQCPNGEFKLTPKMHEVYQKNGYIIIRNLLSTEEIKKVKKAVENKNGVVKHTFNRSDKKLNVGISLWNNPGNDVTGVLSRINKIAGTMEELMGGEEIYHYHNKLVMKPPRSGGEFLWHQDYGYWYHYSLLLPETGTAFLPIDDCSIENGCLQVLKGSHKMGRLDHCPEGEQQSVADKERLEQAKKAFELVHVEMNGGDVLFFDGNLLHTSAVNNSDKRRWCMAIAYNKRRNDPYRKHHHASYRPMHKLDNSALMQCTNEEDLSGKWFMNDEDDGLSHKK